MSKMETNQRQRTILDFMNAKKQGQRFSVITCYDAAFARLIEASSIDMVLVGDSLANVMLGHRDTLAVTLDEMIHHCRAVTQVLRRPFVVGDLPFGSYQESPVQAVASAIQMMKRGGVQAVKLEGGEIFAPHVKAISDAGIPVVGHLGLTPQSYHQLGGYRVQGRTDEQRSRMLTDARSLQAAGAFAVVLELVQSDTAEVVSDALDIPTIGIGAGSACDAQVLVLHDMLGFDDSFQPKFLKKYLNLGEQVREALQRFDEDVKIGSFPQEQHGFLPRSGGSRTEI